MSPYVEALIYNEMVFGDGDFGQQLDLDKVISLRPHDEITVLVILKGKRDQHLLCLCHVRTQ